MSDVAFDVRRFMSRPEWFADAECRGLDPELFYPTGREDAIERALAEARTICRRCDVQAECLAFALNGRESGIWAGTSERQRRNILRGGTTGRGPLPTPTALDAHEHGTPDTEAPHPATPARPPTPSTNPTTARHGQE